MNEADVVCAIESGVDEAEICCEMDITFKQIDDIMEGHGFVRLDGEWKKLD